MTHEVHLRYCMNRALYSPISKDWGVNESRASALRHVMRHVMRHAVRRRAKDDAAAIEMAIGMKHHAE